jgi:mercuric ion binding protein
MRNLLAIIVFCAVAFAENVVVTLEVKDMDCTLCVIAINQALRKTDGVIQAKASLPNKNAIATVPKGFDVKKLEAAIASTGYKGVATTIAPAP